ncbi:MAG: tetratricopeptide repeat protein [Elusimicrobia bacterium]|nr:tetratricopeptide repeat protein [Elusimicrobiota bacterium]
MLSALLAALFVAATRAEAAPRVSDARFRQEPDGLVHIAYTLDDPGDSCCEIGLWLSQDGGKTFALSPRTLKGDVGRVTAGGEKHAVWDASADYPALSGKDFVFLIQARNFDFSYASMPEGGPIGSDPHRPSTQPSRADQARQLAAAQSQRASQVHYLSGVVYFQKGEYERARDEWSLSLGLDPSNTDARAGLEKLEKLFGKRPDRPASRRDLLKPLWPSRPGDDSPEGRDAPLAGSARDARSPESPLPPAGIDPTAVSEDARRSSQQHYLSGVIYFQKGDYKKARDEWTLSTALDPNNPDSRNGLKRLDELYKER